MHTITAAFPTLHKALQAQQELLDNGFAVMPSNEFANGFSQPAPQTNLVSNAIADDTGLTNPNTMLTVSGDPNLLHSAKTIISNNEGQF